MSDRYVRQELFSAIGKEGQRKLAHTTVVIIGCGALGCTSANLLVRSGVNRVKIIDRDFIEESNLQRQTLFDEEDLWNNLPKAIAAQKKLQKINSGIIIEAAVTDINPSNIDTNLHNANIIIDGTDNFETRFLINDYCVKNDIPWIYGACIGSTGLTMTIVPGETPCLRCVMQDIPPFGNTETCDTAGILSPAASLIASIQVAEALKILTGNGASINRQLLKFDLWKNEITRLNINNLREINDCKACKNKQYEYLRNEKYSSTTSLCGRNAVQIAPANGSTIDLSTLASRLSTAGNVSFNKYLLRLKVNNYELTAFPDGRTIIAGTNDVITAKGIYAKYIGM
ncbi:MAG: ThiF family adenylyltransferase [Candidatus Kuenenia stuttgartiensis]|uniref:Similar to molybdopterine biosynthesis protein MoeB n=1 Tax=Kuenenia stuttgartiensis TaxID=174633 RepID=Q1Q0I7_KUEST|nr:MULTISPECIES: ThiF family adenylyltransferase [Kuenenia]MBE7549116.1 ThiF family adenylyltransferase [Planctomycetia bacterium]MBW7943432.1 ThiF family adenylyltransferase [Candidatus Kuenenia stuttgartiensis]MBZ0193421.1 ThiF family adenylyltransferase [Candidatus Kuenenia stuttgartiensis]MCF6152580.1 thiazole biosynthesis adenylyltransferase ThiF [Candidatus Kuenenia stuttgartiensis]MCL4728750.1 ThiF family adenylyltransferase [Candidatus Kuenenia stuttgartiensis]